MLFDFPGAYIYSKYTLLLSAACQECEKKSMYNHKYFIIMSALLLLKAVGKMQDFECYIML